MQDVCMYLHVLAERNGEKLENEITMHQKRGTLCLHVFVGSDADSMKRRTSSGSEGCDKQSLVF